MTNAGDPPCLKKAGPCKQYCYETVEQTVSSENIHDFEKIPKRSYEIKITNFNQLDFSINHMMFAAAQYHLIDKF